MKIQYHHLKNHIEGSRRKTAEQHYKDSSFNKFKEKFNLNDDFFTEKNLNQLKEDAAKLVLKFKKKNEFTFLHIFS